MVRPGVFARHPTARWRVDLVGRFETIVVPPGEDWPLDVRLDGDLGPLRVVPAEHLGPADGVRPDVLEHWLRRRSGPT